MEQRRIPLGRWPIGILAALAGLCCLQGAAEARPARCFTSDDGSYRCQFRATGRDGSFEISAPGKPTYALTIVEPGAALGFANFGDRNVALPGRYLRSKREPACWENDATGARLCAR